MTATVATLPATAQVAIIRSALIRERGMRVQVHIANKAEKIAEMDRALAALDIIEIALRQKGGE